MAATSGVDFRGREGKTLQSHWADGPRTHRGATTSDFPNLFFVNGPGVPFANNPPTIEVAADFVVDLIARAEDVRKNGNGSAWSRAQHRPTING